MFINKVYIINIIDISFNKVHYFINEKCSFYNYAVVYLRLKKWWANFLLVASAYTKGAKPYFHIFSYSVQRGPWLNGALNTPLILLLAKVHYAIRNTAYPPSPRTGYIAAQ